MSQNSGYFSSTQVAVSTPFNNTTDRFEATNVQSAIEEATLFTNFGDGSDGTVTLSSGTVNLSRDMYYLNLTVNSGATFNTNGWKVYVLGTLSGSGIIANNANGVTGAIGNTVGAGQTGGAGGAGGAILGGTGAVGTIPAALNGYGGQGGGGAASGGAASAAGSYNYLPERIIRHDHIALLNYKQGGQGGSGGAGANGAALTTGSAGGQGGGGGGVVFIFAKNMNFTGTIEALGGNGANGSAANNGTGGGGGGGGGGFIYVVCMDGTASPTTNVSGGNGGTGANTGSKGSNGHYSIYTGRTGSWTVA
jgi:hypothetical protein